MFTKGTLSGYFLKIFVFVPGDVYASNLQIKSVASCSRASLWIQDGIQEYYKRKKEFTFLLVTHPQAFVRGINPEGPEYIYI